MNVFLIAMQLKMIWMGAVRCAGGGFAAGASLRSPMGYGNAVRLDRARKEVHRGNGGRRGMDSGIACRGYKNRAGVFGLYELGAVVQGL